jgi:primosomal protein N' (replication factor Y)
MELDVADVVVDVRTRDIQPTWTYRVPPGLDSTVGPGVLVVVGFSGSTVLGYVVARRRCPPDKLGFELAQLKPILSVAKGARLLPEILSLARFAAAEYAGPLWMPIHAAVPQCSRSRLRGIWEAVPGAGPEPDEASPEGLMLKLLNERGGEARERDLLSLTGEVGAKALAKLRRKGLVRRGWELVPPPTPRPMGFPLRCAPVEVLGSFIEGNPRRKAQVAAARALVEHAGSVLTVSRLKELGIKREIREKLEAAGLLVQQDLREVVIGSAPPDHRLLEGQSRAIERICAALRAGGTDRFLLHGVTASGKTEVYQRAADESLSLGRTALLLVPEIALAGQVVQRVRERFGEAVSVIHSALGPADRFTQWQRIARGDTPIVVGPRSAVFAPLPALGLIVIDEEHESSYKQGHQLRYDARLLAQRRAKEAGAVLVLGSATPSVETYSRAEEGLLALVDMPERVTRQAPPEFEVLDLRELRPTATVFSAPMIAALGDALLRREQVILFLNRRAFAPFLLCRECGNVPECSRCSVSLPFHRQDGVLRCHHCGLERQPPDTCPKCGGTQLLPFGLGTERVEEDVLSLFQHAKVGRLDRDTPDADRVLDRFRSGEIEVLIGTQMVAKGLDFPRVTLVGVVSADTGLHMPDFRAGERTFQLLVQVAGRAGRANMPGRVLVQTFSPEHPAITCAARYDYERFYRREMAIRKEAGYPPFRRLAHLLFSDETSSRAQAGAVKMAKIFREAKVRGLDILGPAPSMPEKVLGLYRWSLLLKFPANFRPGPTINEAVRSAGRLGARLTVDVDPQSLS